jgi:hypothetical protein
LKKYHFVYETTNLINGKKYIGKHSTGNRKDSYFGSNKQLKEDIKKHGVKNFNRAILKEFSTEEESYEFEKQMVTIEIANDPMYYNRITGGYGMDSEYLKELWTSPERRDEMSKVFKKLWKTLWYRNKVLEARNTPESKRKQKEARDKLWEDPEYRKKMWEISQTPEYKEAHKQITTKLWQDPEYRNKIQEIMDSSEYKEKISKETKRLWQDPEYREKVIRRTKEALNKPETKKKMSDHAKKLWSNPKHRKKISEMSIGERNPNAKLTEEDVIDIKKRLLKGERGVNIAKIYGVLKGQISKIKCGREWKHIQIAFE